WVDGDFRHGVACLVSGDHVVLKGGDGSPIAGRTIIDPFVWPDKTFDRNDLGGYAALVALSGDPGTATLLVKNSAKLVQQGDALSSLAPGAVDFIVPPTVRISNSGNVYWSTHVTGPPGENFAFMRDLDVIARSGVTAIGGQLMANYNIDTRFQIS